MDKPVEGGSSVPWWLAPWLSSAALAPNQLSQPILSGWSLISVTEQNSSRPETERAIVAEESYGRQIGRLMEAVTALIAERPAGAPKTEAFTALEELSTRIEKIKCDAAEKRVDRLREDLAALKAARPEAYAARVAELRALIG